jgi:RNA polymerase sigma factor (sigma-70 family)
MDPPLDDDAVLVPIRAAASVWVLISASSGTARFRDAGCDRRRCGHLPSVDFEELYRVTYPRVRAYTRSMASPEDADDAVAETYAIAWRRQRDIPRGAELGWLIGVARRVLANARRSRRRAGALHALLDLQPRAPGPDPAERVEDGELRAALMALSPLDREAVVLTSWFDLSSADAARALGVTPAAFRMRTARARRRLRYALNPTMTKESPRWNET